MVAGLILYVWSRQVGLRSGGAKRLALALLLVVPLLTAAVPGRDGLEFRSDAAILDSGRLLAIPLGGPVRVAHVALLFLVGSTVLTVVQELGPVLRRRRRGDEPGPDALRDRCRALPGWERCEVRVRPGDRPEFATGGRPGRPRVYLTRGALDSLEPRSLDAALRHEHAHWTGGRWITSHALFAVRLLQLHNPVALWAFREYCVEEEIRCDAEAVRGDDPRLLARTLLETYESTHHRDVSARAALRKRVDLLLETPTITEEREPLRGTVLAAAILLLGVLPWLV
jgi:hypothetical protein